MYTRPTPLLLVLLGAAGCASPPQPEYGYADVAHRVQLAAGRMEIAEPAALPDEDELAGAHPADFYVFAALERNPEILAAQRSVAAQAEQIPQVTALDDPMLTDTFWPIPEHSPQTASGRMPNSLMVSQMVPWLGKLRVRGEVAEQETRMALARFAQAQLRVAEEVQLAYYEVYYHQRAIEITSENEKLLRDLVKFADIRFRVGAVSQQDVLRAQVEVDRVQNRLIELRQELRLAQADLAALLHTSPEAELEAAATLPDIAVPEHMERLYDSAVRCRPELQEQFYAILRDQRSEELARMQYYPDVTLGVGWDLMTTSQALSPVADGKDNVGFTFGVTLPIWQDKLRAGVREAEHRAVASARQYDSTRDDTFRRIKRLTVQSRALEQQITLFRESILPKSEQTLRISTSDYQTGRIDFLQVFTNWSELFEFQIQLVRLEANLRQTLASLERVVGCQLAALPIEVQPEHSAQPAPAPALPPAPPAENNGSDEPEQDTNESALDK